MTFKVPEQHRVPGSGNFTFGPNGHFRLPAGSTGRGLFVVASDGGGWEHVSVSILGGQARKPPNWEEMCRVKDLFWDADDVVIQYHPAKSEYVNNVPGVLHLWRPIGVELPVPRTLLIGQKGEGLEETRARVERGEGLPPEVLDEDAAKRFLEASDMALDRFRVLKYFPGTS